MGCFGILNFGFLSVGAVRGCIFDFAASGAQRKKKANRLRSAFFVNVEFTLRFFGRLHHHRGTCGVR